MTPYFALVTSGTCLRMVLLSGEREDWVWLLPTGRGAGDGCQCDVR